MRRLIIVCGVIVALILSVALAPIVLTSLMISLFAGMSTSYCDPSNPLVAGVQGSGLSNGDESWVGPNFSTYLGSNPNNRSERIKHAKLTVDIGVAREETKYDITVAVATAIQESDLINTLGGDRDSAGLFQQRPSQGWGTYEQVIDPVYAINTFYDRLSSQPGRTGILIQDAMTIQRPNKNEYYKRWKWDPIAQEIVANLTSDSTPPPGSVAQVIQPLDVVCDYLPSTNVDAIIQTARTMIGKPYAWGGEDPDGFDCSGLMFWAYGEHGVKLPRSSRDQYKGGDKVDKADLRPGDLVYWASNTADTATINHVAMWLGNDEIIEAANANYPIRVTKMRWNGFVGATRPVAEPVSIEANPHSIASGWQLPVEPGKYRVSSHFDPNRIHPIHRTVRPHRGIDLSAPTGTPVVAIADGVVEKRYYDAGGGNMVVLDHGGGIKSHYLHLHGFAFGLNVGNRIPRGGPIGTVGSTGGSTGPHLHLETHEGGQAIDPRDFMGARGLRF